MCNVFVFCLKKQYIYFFKSFVDFEFISLIHSYVYINIALCYQEFYLQVSCNIYCSQKVGDIRLAKIITFTKRMSKT